MKLTIVTILGLVLAGCSSQPEQKKAAESAPAPEPEKKAAAPNPLGTPEVFKVRFETSKGPFVLEVHRDWAPKGVDRFYELIKAGYYNDARFFRVVPNFVAQFGIAANPAVTKKWDKNIDDDPVTHGNGYGTVTFATAGRNTRTTQLFINLRSNQSLDADGFAAFGRVVEGMDIVEKLYSGYGEQPDQDQITRRGNAYLTANFPKLDYIKTATIL
jgi:peptidyl-prolyl cis-trans isomerase A (cyclophilin A)